MLDLPLSGEDAREEVEEDARENVREDVEEDARENVREDVEEDVEEDAREDVRELSDLEKEILEVISAIKLNHLIEIERMLYFEHPFAKREKILLQSILVYLAIAEEKEESDILLEEETVMAILEKVSSHVNIGQLTAFIRWEMNPDDVFGLARPMRKPPKDISDKLLQTYFIREVVPTSKFFLYTAICLEAPKEEFIGTMFSDLISLIL